MTYKLFFKIYQFCMALAIIVLVGILEPLYFPVVRDWTVTEMKKTDTHIILSGYMKKVRQCKFIGVLAEDDLGESVPLVFMDNKIDNTYTRPVGSQDWGPWQITIPKSSVAAKVTFSSTHDCHPAWYTKTHLGEVNLFPGIPK